MLVPQQIPLAAAAAAAPSEHVDRLRCLPLSPAVATTLLPLPSWPISSSSSSSASLQLGQKRATKEQRLVWKRATPRLIVRPPQAPIALRCSGTAIAMNALCLRESLLHFCMQFPAGGTVDPQLQREVAQQRRHALGFPPASNNNTRQAEQCTQMLPCDRPMPQVRRRR